MRRAVLLRSVQRRLSEGEQVREAAYMWRRHRWGLPFAGVVFVVLAILAGPAGFETWPSRIGIGLAGAAVAATAATDYRILALTDVGLVVLRSSRIRQAAVELVARLDDDVAVERLGGTMLANDWRIGSDVYTVAKSSEDAMSAIATTT